MEQILQFRWWAPADWAALFQTIGPPLLRAALFALATWYLARLARSSFEHATRRTGADPNLRLLVGRLAYLAVLALGALVILDIFGVPLSALVTVVGVVGIGISLALQDILKNFFAGTYLLFERPFRIGDEISVKDQRGVVETIGVRTTILRTAANVQVMIPNAIVFAEVVANRTYERKPDDATGADQVGRVELPSAAPPRPPAAGLDPSRAAATIVAGLGALGYSAAATWGRLRDVSTSVVGWARTVGR